VLTPCNANNIKQGKWAQARLDESCCSKKALSDELKKIIGNTDGITRFAVR